MERSSVDLLDVLAFVRVVETGAFSRAAERMGMAKSILSRRVARLEEQLGVEFVGLAIHVQVRAGKQSLEQRRSDVDGAGEQVVHMRILRPAQR